jgi:LacI family transcriptional regulator of maltose regulon
VGYCATLIKYGLPFHSEWVVECESSQKQAAEVIGAMLRRNPTISAVICYNDTIAMGAWFGLIRAGRQSGEGGETFFGQQGALGAFADVGENALDECRSSGQPHPHRDGAHAGCTESCSESTTPRYRPASDCGSTWCQ